MVSRTLPEGQSESFTYDDTVGNRKTHTDFNGNTHSYQYDNNYRVSQIDYADGRVETFQYDAVGNRTNSTITDGGLTRIWSYAYDNLNRLKTETKPDGSKLDYRYDEAGNKSQLITTPANGSSQTTTYTYDQLNRLESVTDATGTTSYGYDKVGNRKSVSYPNGSSQVYTYDTLNRLTLLQTYDGSGALVQSYTYTLHPTGRRTAITESSGRSTSYSYDMLYRMTGESIVDAVNGNHSATYTYDKVGNRQQSIVNGITTAYTYDDNDRLTQTGGISYSHDNNGNTLTETDNGVTTTYVYNSKNHLVSSSKNGVLTRYRYNPNGIRHQQSTPATTTDYLVDQNRDYAQVLVELENNVAAASYSYGDDLISQQRGGVTSYYHYDGLGSTRALSDASGAMTDSYDYEAFGEVLNRTGTTENDYLFTGEQYDAGLGQYYLRARYYDQGVGRFTQQDTYQGRMSEPVTLHKYLYANGDPIGVTDPSGYVGLVSFSVAGNIQSSIRLGSTQAASQFGRQVLHRAVTLSLRAAGQATREVKHCLRNPKKCRLSVPVIVTGGDLPDTSQHIRDAQTGNGSSLLESPFLLNYKNRPRKAWYRNSVECRHDPARKKFNQVHGNNGECDEFPYLKSLQGGPSNYPGRVSLRLTRKGESSKQGGRYGSFVVKAKLNTGKRLRDTIFLSIGVPELPSFEYYPRR